MGELSTSTQAMRPNSQKLRLGSASLSLLTRGVKQVCWLAEHLKESAVPSLNQPKKLLSVTGPTSNSVSSSSRVGFLFPQHPLLDFVLVPLQCSNIHSLDTSTSTAALEQLILMDPSFLSTCQQAWKTVVEILNWRLLFFH